MTTDWSRVPVVVGAGQVTNREGDPAAAPDPFELMSEAATGAFMSAGVDVPPPACISSTSSPCAAK